MKGQLKTKYKKFEYYLRQCRDCDELFKASSRKMKYCPICKKVRVTLRLKSSYDARGITIKEGFKMIDELIDIINKDKEVKNVNTKLDCQSKS